MGQRVAELLTRARTAAKKQRPDMVEASGLSLTSITDYENNKSHPEVGLLPCLADAYGVTLAKVVRTWLEDAIQTQQGIDRLAREVFAPEADFESSLPGLIDSLVGRGEVHRAAQKVLAEFEQTKNLLQSSMHTILRALTRIPELHVRGGKAPMSASIASSRWEPITGDSQWQQQVVFWANRPTKMLAQLHRVPVGVGGLHRQCDTPSRPAYYEVWAVVGGTGVLLVQPDGTTGVWETFPLKVGECGSYFGAHRHVWLNTDASVPLDIFHIFFPFRAHDSLDELLEFPIHDPGDRVHADVRAEIKTVVRKNAKKPVRSTPQFATSKS